MGCASNRKKQTHEFAETKWEYISLDDFKSKGCGAYFAYGYLWFMLFISIAVYAVDSFTAVNLIVFNKWSSKIEPTIPFDVSKWIFSVCIILSFVNLAFEAVRTIRVMKRGNVAECFMDTLAVRWESIRFGSGKGWKRFLVFAELTKSKKGSEYVALFTYFSFKCKHCRLSCSTSCSANFNLSVDTSYLLLRPSTSCQCIDTEVRVRGQTSPHCQECRRRHSGLL